MLSATSKPFMLSVIMLNVIMLSVVMLCVLVPFQPGLVFAGKTGAYPSEAPFRCSTPMQAPGLAHKH